MVGKLAKRVNQKLFPKTYLFAPEWIVLGVNNVCNLHCKMCDVGTKNLESNFAQNLVGTHPINMPLELIEKVINQTALYYPKAKLAYAFTEPMVYPHLIESLQLATAKNLYTTVTTNALTLKQKAGNLSETKLNELYISLDGPQDIHNEIRGHKKSFQKAIEGIEIISKQKHVPRISVICAITEWNIGHLKELLEALKPYPIYEVGFMHTQFNTIESAKIHNQSKWGVDYPTHDSNVDIIDFSKMNLEILNNEISSIKKEKFPFNVYFSPEIQSLEGMENYYHNTTSFIGKSCNAVFTNLMIKSDGSVIPAHGRCYNLTVGNLYNSSLKDIWKSPKLKKLRTDLTSAGGLFPSCSRCCSAV